MRILCGTVGLLESSKDTYVPLEIFDCQYRRFDIAEKRQDE